MLRAPRAPKRRMNVMAIDAKKTIAETLFRLLERKPVDKITVKELVDACGISRQGFYYHFRDIMEVVEWAPPRRSRRRWTPV